MYEAGYFVISTLVVLTWLLGGAIFWYTDMERTTDRLSLEIMAIRFESHIIVAKKACGAKAVSMSRPTGTIECRPIGSGMAEVDIQLETGERHKEVIYFDD